MILHTTLLSSGKTAAGVVVPTEIVDALGAGRRPAVRVTINGHTYRSSIAVRGGRYLLGVSSTDREAAGIRPGDDIDIELVLDTEPREVTVPPELGAALRADPAADERFRALSYSARQRHVLPIQQAKTAETRRRRIEATLRALNADPTA